MKTFRLIAILLALPVITGCDPIGLRRVQLQLRQPPPDAATISVEAAEVKEAIQVLDKVVKAHGFNIVEDYPDQNAHGFIRLYLRPPPPYTVDGWDHIGIPIRVKLTASGLVVNFGEMGFLGGAPKELVDAFADTRHAFIEKFGWSKVKSSQFGGPDQDIH